MIEVGAEEAKLMALHERDAPLRSRHGGTATTKHIAEEAALALLPSAAAPCSHNSSTDTFVASVLSNASRQAGSQAVRQIDSQRTNCTR